MMDDFDATFSAAPVAPCLTIRISKTEETLQKSGDRADQTSGEQMSLMMQRFTAYVIEINDFGKVCEVSHRYSDFEALYKAGSIECRGMSWGLCHNCVCCTNVGVSDN
eukprot:s2378_g5.t1